MRSLKGVENPIIKIEVCKKESLRNYKGSENVKMPYLKIYCKLPGNVASIRNFLKEPRKVGGIDMPTLSFESNMPFALRFMIDKDIVGMGWIRLLGGKYKEAPLRHSRCQLELDVDHQYVVALPTSDYPMIAPLRVLSFDIECAAPKGFPNPEVDCVIQIACVVKEHNSVDELVRVVFTYMECENIPGAHVKWFHKE